MQSLSDLIIERIVKTPNLLELFHKIQNNEKLSIDDGISLYNTDDILVLGYIAEFSRIKRLKASGKDNEEDYVYWINNHHLNLTNICEGTCKFCAYKRKEAQDGAFLFSLESAKEYIQTKVNPDISEIHIVSALNPQCNLNFYIEILKYCKKYLPNTHIQAFTAVEIDYLAKISGLSINETLKELKNAGLGSIPGGGAEIFAENIRQKVCPDKISGEKWLEIMNIAHNMRIRSNATMLTGIGESIEDKVAHILSVRELQEKTGGFMTFIPLFCHYENTEISSEKLPTGIDMLKEYAVSRILLDNIDHIKTFWIQTGIKLAQMTLTFGADDLDGTVVVEKITNFAGAKTDKYLQKDELISLIKNAGKIPVERDTLYNIVKVY